MSSSNLVDDEPVKRILLPEVKFTPALQQLHSVQKCNGIYYENKEMFEKAIECFDEALQLKPEDCVPRIHSSKCNYELVELDTALQEIEVTLQLNNKYDLKLRHHRIDCKHNQNNFEQALIDAHRTRRRSHGCFNTEECVKRINALDSTIDFTIGKYAGNCLLNQRDAIAHLEKLRQSASIVKKNVCGVSSEPDLVKKKFRPLLKKRIKQNRNAVNEIYLGTSCNDYNFLNQLLKHKLLHLSQTKSSNDRLLGIVGPSVCRVTKWRDMLRKRQPVYSKKFNLIQDAKKAEEHKQAILNRIQRQTRRDVFKQIVIARKLAENNKLDELIKYIFSVLNDYYSIKTKRVFPRIFEFRNELCNIVALAYLNQIKVSKELIDQPNNNFLHLINGKSHDNEVEIINQPNMEYGDHDAFNRVHSVDNTFWAYKNKIQSLEQLITTLDAPIEKCFLYYEISQLHWSQMKLDEARSTAQRVFANSEICGNSVWQYLACLQMVRIDFAQQNFIDLKAKLQIMKDLSLCLNTHIEHFTHVAILLNDIDLDQKEREEQEKREEQEREEELRRKRREMFLRMSIALERASKFTAPPELRRHEDVVKDLSTLAAQNSSENPAKDETHNSGARRSSVNNEARNSTVVQIDDILGNKSVIRNIGGVGRNSRT